MLASLVCRKQYRIEELEGTKVVKRRPGVSVKTCIKIASTAQSGGTGSLEAPEVTHGIHLGLTNSKNPIISSIWSV